MTGLMAKLVQGWTELDDIGSNQMDQAFADVALDTHVGVESVDVRPRKRSMVVLPKLSVSTSKQDSVLRSEPSGVDVPTSKNDTVFPSEPSGVDVLTSKNDSVLPSEPSGVDVRTSNNDTVFTSEPSGVDILTSKNDTDLPADPSGVDVPTSKNDTDLPDEPSVVDVPAGTNATVLPADPSALDVNSKVVTSPLSMFQVNDGIEIPDIQAPGSSVKVFSYASDGDSDCAGDDGVDQYIIQSRERHDIEDEIQDGCHDMGKEADFILGDDDAKMLNRRCINPLVDNMIKCSVLDKVAETAPLHNDSLDKNTVSAKGQELTMDVNHAHIDYQSEVTGTGGVVLPRTVNTIGPNKEMSSDDIDKATYIVPGDDVTLKLNKVADSGEKGESVAICQSADKIVKQTKRSNLRSSSKDSTIPIVLGVGKSGAAEQIVMASPPRKQRKLIDKKNVVGANIKATRSSPCIKAIVRPNTAMDKGKCLEDKSAFIECPKLTDGATVGGDSDATMKPSTRGIVSFDIVVPEVAYMKERQSDAGSTFEASSIAVPSHSLAHTSVGQNNVLGDEHVDEVGQKDVLGDEHVDTDVQNLAPAINDVVHMPLLRLVDDNNKDNPTVAVIHDRVDATEELEFLYATPALPPSAETIIIGSATPRSKLRMARVVQPSKHMLPPFSRIVSAKDQNKLYEQVIKHHSKCKRSRIKNIRFLQISPMWVYCHDLADSVMPDGELSSTVARIGISVIQQECPKKKIIFPWIVTVYLLERKFDSNVLRKHFRRDDNYKLSHQNLLSFVVLQNLGTKKHPDGHWYVVSLNLDGKRFEVLDSVRDNEDETLIKHATLVFDAIKGMYKINYSNSSKQIEDYELVYIDVPKQNNRFDCGYFMLKFLELCNGRVVPAITFDQIPELRKVYHEEIKYWNS
ncbi:hypothetical protein ACQ4PT_069377 [Festuca glaucescens]